MVVGLSGRAVVASIAGAALGWRLETSLGVVVVEERGRRVIGSGWGRPFLSVMNEKRSR
jgi:hypothetical protein